MVGPTIMDGRADHNGRPDYFRAVAMVGPTIMDGRADHNGRADHPK